jgi:hypothetical protein
VSVAVTTCPTGNRLSAGMTCPRCGHPMAVVNSSQAFTREWRAVMRCGSCRASQLLLVRLVDIAEIEPPANRQRYAECGTQAGYSRHRRHHQTPCDDCKAAHATSERAYVEKNGRRR